MPLIVDHDERRAIIADIVKEMIAETGMDSVTVRAVARKAGYSSTILSHYFRDKQHLLISAFASVLGEAPKRVEAVMEARGTMLECLCALLPTTESNLRDWQAWFGFWGKATHDPALAEERLIGIEETRKMLHVILEYGIKRDEAPANLDIPYYANHVQIYLNGLAAMVITKPEDWPMKDQQAALKSQVMLMSAYPEGPED